MGLIFELVFAIRKKEQFYWALPSFENQFLDILFLDSIDSLSASKDRFCSWLKSPPHHIIWSAGTPIRQPSKGLEPFEGFAFIHQIKKPSQDHYEGFEYDKAIRLFIDDEFSYCCFAALCYLDEVNT